MALQFGHFYQISVFRNGTKISIKDYQKHEKYIDERIRKNPLLKQQKAQEKERQTVKKGKIIIDDAQKLGGEWTLNNF